MIAATAQAQVAAWLDFDGKIPGESAETSHRNWIEIQGFQLGGQLHARLPGSLGLTKSLDRASPKLYQACAQGTHYAKAILDLSFTSPVTGHPSPARIEFEDVFVSTNAISSGGDRPTESFDLVFGRIVYTYFTGTNTSEVSNYDFRTGTGSTGPTANPDSDSDGLPDAWETTYGLSVGSNDANGDADGDGLTNLQEYQLGTHPKSGTSFFRAALAPMAGSPGNYQLSWNSVIGKTYVIEWSPDLQTPFATLRNVTASATTTTESIVNTGNVGFYRVRPQ
jgi:type VI protein secretion system component Hcp